MDINKQLEKYFEMKTLPIHVNGHDFQIQDGEIIYKAYKYTATAKKKLVFIVRDDRIFIIAAKMKKYKTLG